MERKSRVAGALAILAAIADGIINLIERAIVLGVEALRRAWHRLNPYLYSERLRIRCITEGLPPKGSDKVAVFVVYSRSGMPNFTMNFIAALNRHSFNVIIVSNDRLDTSVKTALLGNCCLLVERVNVGRDFGGYKDGIGIAVQRFPDIRRLIIGNDSLYYFNRGLDELITALDGPEDFIGVSEVYEHHYHVASFLLSFGPGVLDDPAFRRFWTGYLPIPTRMWAILEGEGELTRVLVEAGHRPHVLFRADALLFKLQALSATETADTLALLPRSVRDALPPFAAPLRTNPAPRNLAEAVYEEVMARNQMHAAGFAFMKYMGLPLLKRDIVFRELFSLREVKQIIAGFGEAEPMQAEIMDDLARRPPPSRFAVVHRLFYRHGHF